MPLEIMGSQKGGKEIIKTLPVLPNFYPYNEMLLQGILKLGRYRVKTRNWKWNHRGLVLLYTSTGTHSRPTEAYGFDAEKAQRKVIVGCGTLVDVRELDKSEQLTLMQQFNRMPRERVYRRNSQRFWGFIVPGTYGLFFQKLRRFRNPTPFQPPRGAISIFRAPVELVKEELERVGYNLD